MKAFYKFREVTVYFKECMNKVRTEFCKTLISSKYSKGLIEWFFRSGACLDHLGSFKSKVFWFSGYDTSPLFSIKLVIASSHCAVVDGMSSTLSLSAAARRSPVSRATFRI